MILEANLKVLIVDDSAVQRKRMTTFLQPLESVEILEAQDGIAALECLQRESNVELMITDWNMPRMDGLCLVKSVRSNPKFTEMQIMMVTTENDPWSVTRAIRSGANEYLMKPFDQPSFLDKLAVLLGSQHPALERRCV